MAYAMTKRGTQDNEVVYEFVCDGISDMNAIENRYRTIGSVAVVLRGESDDLEVYIADSHKSWVSMTSVAAGDTGSGMTIHVCTQNEISSGKPNIAEPDETVIYLVANSSNETGNLYDEFVYVDSAWEKIGSAGIDLSGYATVANPTFEGTLSLGRKENTTVGQNSVALGYYVTASGYMAHAEGNNTTASGSYSHAEGSGTTASEFYTHAEGYTTTASGQYAHAEGDYTTASATGAHSEGYYTAASGYGAHAEGGYTHATGYYTHAEGQGSNYLTKTINNQTYYPGAHGSYSHSEGYTTFAIGSTSHAEGEATEARGYVSHAEGYYTIAEGYSHAEGYFTQATNNNTHAEGQYTIASDSNAHAEGDHTTASGYASHAEGYQCISSGTDSHAEGYYTVSSGAYSHAEGNSTVAADNSSHVVGKCNVVDQYDDAPEWVSGTSYNVGDRVKRTYPSLVVYYICKTANNDAVWTQNKWKNATMHYVEIVGNGEDSQNRSNARALTWTGDEKLRGDLYVHANADSTGGNKVATEAFVTARIPAPPVSDGTYNLQVSISSGVATYSWVSTGGTSSPTLISFSIESAPYQAVSGSTWADFVSSTYNTDNKVTIDGNYIYYNTSGADRALYESDGVTQVQKTDTIVASTDYMILS